MKLDVICWCDKMPLSMSRMRFDNRNFGIASLNVRFCNLSANALCKERNWFICELTQSVQTCRKDNYSNIVIL